jgi:transcriptional regulator with XRE-family HTH domain
MGMSCTICNHNKRIEIDREIVQGKSHAKIAREFGVDSQAVRSHAENHLSRQLAKAWEKKELTESFGMLQRIETILTRTEKIFKRNYDKERDALALKALSESRSTLELLAKISYALHEVRLAELASSHGDYDSRKQQEQAEFAQRAVDRLTDSEAMLLARLIAKVNGEHNDIIQPGLTFPRMPEPSKTKSNACFFDGPYNDTPESEDADYGGNDSALNGFKRTIDPPYRGVKRLDPENIPSAGDKMKTRIARKKLERLI